MSLGLYAGGTSANAKPDLAHFKASSLGASPLATLKTKVQQGQQTSGMPKVKERSLSTKLRTSRIDTAGCSR